MDELEKCQQELAICRDELEKCQQELAICRDELEKYKGLLKIWTKAYEKAIVQKNFRLSKSVIDRACIDAVDAWTQHLREHNKITEIKEKELDTIADCITHHVDNLKKGGMWRDDEETQPKSTQIPEYENVWMIEIPVCDYKDSCEWGRTEKHFDLTKGNFRCQRLGCFVAAIKKYMTEEKLPESERETVTYFMTKVHTEQGCQGLIYLFKGNLEDNLKDKYLPKTN